jgi:hypothetical protein
MRSKKQWTWPVGVIVVAAGVLCEGGAVAAGPPAAPQVSTFAPVKNVVAQIEYYLGRLEESVTDLDTYKDFETRVSKDANTLILLALAAGLHDEDNPYKAAAPGLLKAAQELAQVSVVKELPPGVQPKPEEVAKRFAAVKAGVAAVKKAAEGKGGDPASLKWAKAADLPELMKQVPLVHNRLKRNLRADRFKKRAAANAGDTTTLAVIAQGSVANTSAVKNAGDEEKWFKLCVEMRDTAAALNKAIAAANQAEADKLAGVLNQNCEDCHKVFSPAAIEKMKEQAAADKDK